MLGVAARAKWPKCLEAGDNLQAWPLQTLEAGHALLVGQTFLDTRGSPFRGFRATRLGEMELDIETVHRLLEIYEV